MTTLTETAQEIKAMEDNYMGIKEKVSDLLSHFLWEKADKSDAFKRTFAVATKEYETAVGPKEAVIYLYPARKSGENCHILNACYHSQGRNVLETIFHSIEPNASNDEIQLRTHMLLEDIRSNIAGTYAVRLLKVK